MDFVTILALTGAVLAILLVVLAIVFFVVILPVVRRELRGREQPKP